jgi:hypothetical protein
MTGTPGVECGSTFPTEEQAQAYVADLRKEIGVRLEAGTLVGDPSPW